MGSRQLLREPLSFIRSKSYYRFFPRPCRRRAISLLLPSVPRSPVSGNVQSQEREAMSRRTLVLLSVRAKSERGQTIQTNTPFLRPTPAERKGYFTFLCSAVGPYPQIPTGTPRHSSNQSRSIGSWSKWFTARQSTP